MIVILFQKMPQEKDLDRSRGRMEDTVVSSKRSHPTVKKDTESGIAKDGICNKPKQVCAISTQIILNQNSLLRSG